jgi:hypothetical protein
LQNRLVEPEIINGEESKYISEFFFVFFLLIAGAFKGGEETWKVAIWYYSVALVPVK